MSACTREARLPQSNEARTVGTSANVAGAEEKRPLDVWPTEEELRTMSPRQLHLAAAMPLARRGHVFSLRWLDEYFQGQDWYEPRGFDAADLPADVRDKQATIEARNQAFTLEELQTLERELLERQHRLRARNVDSIVAFRSGGKETERVLLTTRGRDTLLFESQPKSWRLLPPPTEDAARQPLEAPQFSTDGKRVLQMRSSIGVQRSFIERDLQTDETIVGPEILKPKAGFEYGVLPGGRWALAAFGYGQGPSYALRPVSEPTIVLDLPALGGRFPLALVSLSERGRKMAAVGPKNEIWIWRWSEALSTQGVVVSAAAPTPVGHFSSPSELELSQDGSTLVVVSDGTIYAMPTGEPQRRRSFGSHGRFRSVDLSPDGKYLVGSGRETTKVWLLRTGEEIWSHTEPDPDPDPDYHYGRSFAALIPGTTRIALPGRAGGLTIHDFLAKTTEVIAKDGPAPNWEELDQEAQYIESRVSAQRAQKKGKKPRGSFYERTPLSAHLGRFKQRLSEADLGQPMTLYNLRAARTLIYATHGRVFRSPEWKKAAERVKWYTPNLQYSDSLLTERDKQNLKMILELEERHFPRPPPGPLDPRAAVGEERLPQCPAGTVHKRTSPWGWEITLSCERPSTQSVSGQKAVLHGPLFLLGATGRLLAEHHYVEGKEQGPSRRWYWSGALREQGQLIGGVKEGPFHSYHPNGKLKEEASYKNGEYEGLRKRYFESGKLASSGTYQAGYPEGKWQTFYDNGMVALEVEFRAGELVAPPRGYVPTGEPWPEGIQLGSMGAPMIATELDGESLPPLRAQSCPAGELGEAGAVPAWAKKSLLKVARQAWGDTSYGPSDCVDRLRISCAPNLEERQGGEMIAHIEYRLQDGPARDPCAQQSHSTYHMGAQVVVSPTVPGQYGRWRQGGYLGYTRYGVGEGGLNTTLEQFVLLPDGQKAARAWTDSFDGSSGCTEDGKVILLPGPEKWTTWKSWTTKECFGEVERGDVY